MAKDKKAPKADDSPEAAAALAALGTPQASKDVVALIVGDVVDASRPRYGNASSSQRMLTFSVRCGTTTRRCYEAAPLKAETAPGDAILLKRSVTNVGDLLQLKPTTAEVYQGDRPPPPPPPKPKEGGPPPFEPFDVEAAAKASRERRPPPPPPKARTGLASFDPKERRSVALVVEGLEADGGGGVIIRAGGERLAASAPLRKFLLRDQDPTKVLPKLAPHFAGKTLSLDVERTAAGFVVHNLS